MIYLLTVIFFLLLAVFDHQEKHPGWRQWRVLGRVLYDPEREGWVPNDVPFDIERDA